MRARLPAVAVLVGAGGRVERERARWTPLAGTRTISGVRPLA
ncbi:hypothetical protein [Rhodococcus erythropolis]|nr:hypothetical protein [Rhodococcus erythropolis]